MRELHHSRMGLLVGVVAALLLGTQGAKADFVFGEAIKVPNINSSSAEFSPCISADGLELYFGSNGPHGADLSYADIWVATRTSSDEPWGVPRNLDSPVNSPSVAEANPCISADGLELYFSDTWPAYIHEGNLRPGGYGKGDIWVSRRETREADWGEPVNPGPQVNSVEYDGSPHLSTDGLSLYFSSTRSPDTGGDLYVSTRPTKEDPWGPAVDLGAPINTMAEQDYLFYPFLSYDGLSLFFSAIPWPWAGAGGFSNGDIFVSTRPSRNDEWGVPSRLPVLSSGRHEMGLTFARGGSTLYFGRSDLYIASPSFTADPARATSDIWQVEVIPVVDFNGDEAVDTLDVYEMLEHWGTDNSLYDIAPSPFGDGIVDAKDLLVLAEHMLNEIHVDEADNGGQVELDQGQVLVITLESNPTTGYQWEPLEGQASVLQQMGEAEFRPSETDEPPLVGAGGWDIFRFKAASPGQMTLQLIYHRVWEEGVEPLKTFSIQVAVR